MAGSLLILGKGGYGMVVKEAAEAMGVFEKIEFLDDNMQSGALAPLADYAKFTGEFSHAYAAFGKNNFRMQWLERLADCGYTLPIIIHPRAYVSPSAILGNGVCVLANAAVEAFAQIKAGSIINVGAIADHNCVINQCVHVAPGAVVKAGCEVEPLAKIESGEVVFKTY